MNGKFILLSLILVPLLGSIPVFILGKEAERRKNKGLSKAAGAVFSLLQAAALVLAVIGGIGVLKDGEYTVFIPKVCGLGLTLGLSGFRVLYVLLANLAWTVSSLFSLWYMGGEHHVPRYDFFTLVTLGATTGVFLSEDLYTTFIFFEIMSLASFVWVAQEETKHALKAAETYLAVAVIGGLTMLMGIFLLRFELGTLILSELPEAAASCGNRTLLHAAGFCLLFGFGAKAGIYPLHIWLPKAHPVAPAPASALLSGLLTKSGIFGCLVLCGRIFTGDVFWGKLILVLAVLTMLVGAVIALFSVDMKQVLACSSVSQIGFILTGCGLMSVLTEEQSLAVSGSILHMVNHSLFKLVLFILAGICVKNLASRDLNVLRGFGRNKPWFMVVFLLGALGIAGIPGFSGYVSKTLLHEAIVECFALTGDSFYRVVEVLFLTAGGCTFAYMLKLFVCLFVKEPSEEVRENDRRTNGNYLPLSLKIVLTVVAASIFVMGTLPEWTMYKIAEKAADITVFSGFRLSLNVFGLESLKGGLISIGIGIVLYFAFVRFIVREKTEGGERYVNRWPEWLDLENTVYRPLLSGLLFILQFVLGIFDRLTELLVILLRKTILRPVCEKTTVSLVENVLNGIGHIRNGWHRLVNKLLRKREGNKKDYVRKTHREWEVLTETVNLVSRSLSYGLMAFCLGLIAVMIYLLYRL